MSFADRARPSLGARLTAALFSRSGPLRPWLLQEAFGPPRTPRGTDGRRTDA
ncbi:MAG: hypothetical protein AVDCRST_MAG19-1116 [uncultured Thermomicrobiales bacterium]|uniref:Uncharacterized protein n=1 Tax=uncultured Thermomicrobiales bacterium TaxID=1645740 RepID=A0A6J4UQ32_9BACT|nr:MAG: hypothetical protein AVDCRST_MAG19-1116 [uncultured Thermomicrobiales bacterium]